MTTTTRHWEKTKDGGHIPADYCEWKPNEDTRLTALWLKFWRYEASHGRALSLRTLCPCGYDEQPCPCERDETVAH